MEIWQTTTPPKNKNAGTNGGYVPIDDDGLFAERKLFIEDDEGRMVVLKNEQIGELYKAIKPALQG